MHGGSIKWRSFWDPLMAHFVQWLKTSKPREFVAKGFITRTNKLNHFQTARDRRKIIMVSQKWILQQRTDVISSLWPPRSFETDCTSPCLSRKLLLTFKRFRIVDRLYPSIRSTHRKRWSRFLLCATRARKRQSNHLWTSRFGQRMSTVDLEKPDVGFETCSTLNWHMMSLIIEIKNLS